MIKLPISETVLKFYEEIGYNFTYREQAHLIYIYTSGVLEQVKALKELIKISDDKGLNEEMQERIDYEMAKYNSFVDSHDNSYIYILVSDSDNNRYFRSAEGAMEYAKAHLSGIAYRIYKIGLIDVPGIRDAGNFSFINFDCYHRIYECLAIPECDSIDYLDDDEDFSRFESLFMNVDSPFNPGDIVISPEVEYPVVVLSDTNFFHEEYNDMKCEHGDQVDKHINMGYNCLPVIDNYGIMSEEYYDAFQMDKIDHYKDEKIWSTLQKISSLVKEGYTVNEISEIVPPITH